MVHFLPYILPVHQNYFKNLLVLTFTRNAQQQIDLAEN